MLIVMHRWKLFNQAELLVVPRGSGGYAELQALLHHPENERFARYVQINPLLRCFVTFRQRVFARWAEYEHDIPCEVRHFMHSTHAYTPPIKFSNGRRGRLLW